MRHHLASSFLALLGAGGCGLFLSSTDDGDPAPDASAPESDASPAPTLIDRGLLVRYFIDEATAGDGPTELGDSAPDPANLSLTYTGAMEFTVDGDNRGLRWTSSGTAGRASLNTAAAPKFLGTNTALSIELVVEVDGLPISAGVLLSHDGLALDLRATSGQLELRLNGGIVGAWSIDIIAEPRVVIHAIIDTNRSAAESRARLFVDGSSSTHSASSTAAMGDELIVGDDEIFVLGNSPAGTNSFTGVLFYAAVYRVALSGDEVMSNAALLAVTDDSEE